MKFIIATHNQKKLKELERILAPLGITPLTTEQAGLPAVPDIEEDGGTFSENAFIKAHAFCEHTGFPSVADDSGLCVDALDGAPGIYSARYGNCDSDEERYMLLLENMKDVPDEKRTARFESAVCCVFPNGDTVTAHGICPGKIAFSPSGDGGFGYDPVFLTETGKSFAELSASEKDLISHRGNALRSFALHLKEYLDNSQKGNKSNADK